MAVILYRQVGKGKTRRYQRSISDEAPPADLTGPYFLRYSLADDTVRGNRSATTSMRQSPPASADNCATNILLCPN
jgi:hypothetical protein